MRRAAAFVAAAAGLLLAGAVARPAPAAATPGPATAPEYWFDSWQIPQLWAAGARGQGVTIAEIDTGVNASLPELAGNVLPGTDFGQPGDGRIDRDLSAFGHGTAMASIMVAKPGLLGITGIAPGAELLPIAVPLIGTTDAGPDDHLAEAIRYAVDHGGKVISMSLGGSRTPADNREPCPSAEQEAIYYALSKGAVLLAASGNGGQSGSGVEEPGVCLGVVSVGAVDQSGAVAPFSSRHPYLTLAAPGVGVPSLGREPGTAYSGDGTSQATAIASAVVALEWSQHPTLTGQQVVTRLLATLDGGTGRHDPGLGYGIVDAYRAVTAAVPANAPNPVYSGVAPFLARYLAFTHPVPAPAPRNPATTSRLGAFAVGPAPGPGSVTARLGLATAAAGLVALIGLALAGPMLRRRRGEQPETIIPDVVPSQLDGAGLVWRDIPGPPRHAAGPGPSPGPSPAWQPADSPPGPPRHAAPSEPARPPD